MLTALDPQYQEIMGAVYVNYQWNRRFKRIHLFVVKSPCLVELRPLMRLLDNSNYKEYIYLINKTFVGEGREEL